MREGSESGVLNAEKAISFIADKLLIFPTSHIDFGYFYFPFILVSKGVCWRQKLEIERNPRLLFITLLRAYSLYLFSNLEIYISAYPIYYPYI